MRGRVQRLQPVVGGRLGLRLPGAHLRRPHDHPGRRRGGGRRARPRAGRRRPADLREGRPGPHAGGVHLTGRPALRPVLGPGQRVRRDRGDPLGRCRLRPLHQRLGALRGLGGLPALAAADGHHLRPASLRDHGRAGVPGPLRPVPQRPGGQHRGRGRVGSRPGQEAQEGLRADAVVVRLRPGGGVPPPRVGGPLLRGRHESAEGRARHRPAPVRLGLAPRRRAGRAHRLRTGPAAPPLRRGGDPPGDAGQRSRPHRPGRLPPPTFRTP